MSDFQCKFYLLDGAETLECKDGNAEYVIKIADRPFPDSLLSFVYYDINSWEPRFHEAERSLMEFYQTRDTKCLKPVQELLDDFQPTKISFEFVEEKRFTEVLYPQNMYDLIDFSLRKCVQEKIMMLRSTHHCCTVPLRRRGSYCRAVRFIIHLADRKVQRHWTAMCHFQPYSAHTAYGW